MTIFYLITTPRSSFKASNGDPATGKLISIFSLQVNIFHLLKWLFSDDPSTQALWKLILAEGEKAALIAIAAADQVGVYGLVASLG